VIFYPALLLIKAGDLAARPAGPPDGQGCPAANAREGGSGGVNAC